MSARARELNAAYLQEMYSAPANTTMERIRDLWWPAFLQIAEENGMEFALDNLDLCMSRGRDRLMEMAGEYGTASGAEPGSDVARQLTNQFLKSNTGKMFERLCGLALAHALMEADAAYCIQACRNDTLPLCHGLRRDDLTIEMILGDGILVTAIDADLIAFNPDDADAQIFMMSVKSTLKDRFHNVPFWNLLRRTAISDDFADIAARNLPALQRMKYVAVCSDLAAEQPDFGTQAGARNLLQIDAVLLDGAYVSASRALGLPADCAHDLSEVRQHAFYRYRCFYSHLLGRHLP